MARLNIRLCFRLLPAAAVAVTSTAARGTQRAIYHHHRRPTAAFGWTSRGVSSGDASAERSARIQKLQGTANSTQDVQLQKLADAAPSLLANVVAVASDVDGTLTTPDVTITLRTKQAIKAVMDSGLVFFPATGKVRVRGRRLGGYEQAEVCNNSAMISCCRAFWMVSV